MKIIANKISKKLFLLSLISVLLLAPIAWQNLAKAVTFTPLTGQLDLGARGSNVTNLQTFLASNTDIYPEAVISGYYGLLTRAAVTRFQVNYNLPAVGRVGPMTLAKINNVIAAGYGIDIYAPLISNISVQKTNTTATINWTSTESARGKVYYNTSPFLLSEATTSFAEPLVLGGQVVLASNMQSSQSVTISSLQPNTLYYYMVESIDASENVSVSLASSFVTNP